MKNFLKFLSIPAGLYLIYVLINLIVGFGYVSVPTKGEKIDLTGRTNTAVLVIDVQNKYTQYKELKKSQSAGALLSNLNTIIRYSVQANDKVIYIKQEYSSNSIFNLLSLNSPVKGSLESQLNPALIAANPVVFSKEISDAFSNPGLASYLDENKIGKLIITGIAAEGCVYSTARGGINRGYRVVVPRDAVMSLISDGIKAGMLERYKESGINVVTTADLLKNKL